MEAAMRKIGNLYMFTVGDKKITNCNLPQQPTKKESLLQPQENFSATAPCLPILGSSASCLSPQFFTAVLRDVHT